MHIAEAFNEDGEINLDYNYDEFCPHCDEPIAITIDNDEFTHYEVTCPYCGEKVMLCTLCRWDFGADIICAEPGDECPIKKAERGLIPFPKRLEPGEDWCVSRSVYEETEE